jgi:CheY-like chemotaxis protein
MLLEEFGAMVDRAVDGQDGLEKLEQQSFDVVLMDIQMPVMDGFEATRRIRSQPRYSNLPVIALSANAFPEDQKRCREAGVSDFVAKPANPQTLLSTLRRWWLKAN